MNKLANEWLSFAEKDLKTVAKLLNDPDLTNIVAFHTHQCIEKSFKALIFIKTEKLPKIHNLLRLYGTVRNYSQINIDMNLLEEINETYIDARYPSDLGLLPYGNLSSEKAKGFYQEAQSIYSQIHKEINSNS